MEAILDEVGELTTSGTFTQRNRDQEQIEILREMDRDDMDGIRHRRVTNPANLTGNDMLAPATSSTSSNLSSNSAKASKSRLNHQDSTDKAANTENCTNENSENGNVFEDLPYDSSEPAVAEPVTATPIESSQQIESKESEFRIKLKYLNDDLKLVKGCPNEFIGDFKK